MFESRGIVLNVKLFPESPAEKRNLFRTFWLKVEEPGRKASREILFVMLLIGFTY